MAKYHKYIHGYFYDIHMAALTDVHLIIVANNGKFVLSVFGL